MKVYVVVAVLFKAGVHAPVMPFDVVVANGVSVVPAQVAPAGPLTIGTT